MGSQFPSPGALPNPGIKPRSLTLQADSLPAEPQIVTVIIALLVMMMMVVMMEEDGHGLHVHQTVISVYSLLLPPGDLNLNGH